MKRIILLCTFVVMTANVCAQKANVKKLKTKIEYASTPVNLDFGNLEVDKVQELRDLIEPALTHPESEAMPELWKYATRMKLHDMNEMLKERAANNNEFKDLAAFFTNQADIVSYAEKYIQLLNTPDAKGKYSMKEEEREKERVMWQQYTSNPRNNLFIGASNLVYSNPDVTVKLLEAYYNSFDNPIYADLNLKETDPYYKEGTYIQATALKAIGGNMDKVVELWKQSFDSKNGPLACQDLINYYKEKGDTENEAKTYEMAYEKYPEQLVFGVNIAQNKVLERKYDEAIKICDDVIARMKDGTVQSTDDNGNTIEAAKYPYYFRAIALYNQEKYEEAYNAFEEAVEYKSDYYDCIIGAGNTAARIASMNKDKKAVADKWYGNAIKYYEMARETDPGKSDDWGYPLYASYYNSGNMQKANALKKYAK